MYFIALELHRTEQSYVQLVLKYIAQINFQELKKFF